MIGQRLVLELEQFIRYSSKPHRTHALRLVILEEFLLIFNLVKENH